MAPLSSFSKAVLVLLLFAACDSAPIEDPVHGRWVGEALHIEDGSFLRTDTLDIVLGEYDGALRGSGVYAVHFVDATRIQRVLLAVQAEVIETHTGLYLTVRGAGSASSFGGRIVGNEFRATNINGDRVIFYREPVAAWKRGK